MFFALAGAIWMGGSGPCIIGGLYWKRGTTAGAWSALVAGSSLALSAIIGQQLWVSGIYPWLSSHDMLGVVGTIVEGASAPFEPYIKWRVTPDKFPINSQEMFAITMLVSIGLYIIVSLLTCRQPFNMERMLHRGKYQREGLKIKTEKLTFRNALPKLLGINEEYTRGDKILAWSIFIYFFGYNFLGAFVGIVLWNVISPWSNEDWANWFFFHNFLLAGVIGIVSTIWFSIGTTIDLRRLFRRLAEKETSVLDDGRVIGNISADDVALVEVVENVKIEKAHREEELLEKALRSEQDEEDIKNLHEHQNRKDQKEQGR